MLGALPTGWTAIHDVRWPSRRLANIDHILVGPGGIFVIDSKNWSGRVSVENGHLRQNGRSREKAVAGCADAGLAIAELAGPHADKVFPVLCFVTEERLSGWCRDVMVCSSTTLTQMLLSRPHLLDPDELMDAWLRMDAQLRAATAATSPGTATPPRAESAGRGRPRGPASPSRRPSRSRRAATRRRKALTQFGFSLVVLGAFFTYGPQIGAAVGGLVSEQIAVRVTPPSACQEPSPADRPGDAGAPSARAEGGQQQTGASRVRPRGDAAPDRAASATDC